MWQLPCVRLASSVNIMTRTNWRAHYNSYPASVDACGTIDGGLAISNNKPSAHYIGLSNLRLFLMNTHQNPAIIDLQSNKSDLKTQYAQQMPKYMLKIPLF